jgi:3-oxoacyl-[acyl-carrier-protein] synthase II
MSAPTRRRVVFTGLGMLTSLGGNADATWAALRAGRSGIGPIRLFDVAPLPCRIGGEVAGFDPKKYVADKKKHRGFKMMARPVQMAVSVAEMALTDSGFRPGQLDPTRFGVEFGAGLIPTELDDLGPAARVSVNCQPGSISLINWGEKGIPEIPPLWMLKYLPNMPACHVSILYDAQGPNNTITESEAASLLALGESYRILQRDGADFFLVGGAESKLTPLSMARQSLFLPLSRRNQEPERALRPFDLGRDGTVIGEGGAVFGLEDLDHARRRDARILGELVGFGSAFDRLKTGAGLARAIRAALTEAGVGPEAIDHVNAHGSGSPAGDVWEARGIHEVFGHLRPAVPVWAIKSSIGHTGPASGAVELAGTLLALRDGVVPPTLNHEQPDPACPVAVHTREPRPFTKSCALKVSITDMGQCAAAVVKRWED